MAWTNKYEERKIQEVWGNLPEVMSNEQVIMLAQMWIIEELDHLMTRRRTPQDRQYMKAIIGILRTEQTQKHAHKLRRAPMD